MLERYSLFTTSVEPYTCGFTHQKPSFVQDLGQCHAKGSEGSTEWNQSRPQPRRNKEDRGPSVCTSRSFAVRKDWQRMTAWGACSPYIVSTACSRRSHGSYIAEIAWRYSKEFDSITRLCLGRINISKDVVNF